jgi:hypothetical protein
MAIKGTQAKAEILAKLQEIYPDAFLVDKVLRIPMIEDGQTVEIKITLTAAKDVLGGAKKIEAKTVNTSSTMSTEPTEEEKIKVAEALKSLGMELR